MADKRKKQIRKTIARKGNNLQPKADAGGWQSVGITRLRLSQYGNQPTDLRRDMSAFDRLSMVKKCRWAERNSGLFKQILNDLGIYTVGDGIKHQSHASTPENRDLYNDYFCEWSKKCDITGRFSFYQVQNILFRGMIRDGDSFALKTRNAFAQPKLQIMECHRVGDPLSPDVAPEGMHDGVQFGPYGELAGFNIYRSDGSSRFVIGNSMMHIVDHEYASGARGVPLMQHSLASIQDEMDIIELEKLAVKDNADVTRVIKKTGGFIPGDMKRELGGSDPSNLGYQYASMGGKIIALEPGEEFQSFQSNRPSPAFTGFLAALERDIAQGVLPYEFVSDPTKAGSASIRLIAAKAGRVFGKYQTVMISTLCNPTWGYVIGQAIANGELPDDPCWNEVSWTTPKSVTVDAGREAANDREDLRLGLLSFSEVYNQRGMNFEEEAEIKAQNIRYLLDLSKTYGVPFETLTNILINTPPGTVEQASNPPQPDAETESSS